MYPNIKFRINKKLDKRIAIDFLGQNIGGINFANGILGIHPTIKKMIFNYIDDYYYKNHQTLSEKANKFKKEWDIKANSFFSITQKIFKKHPWPKGKYIGYISIFDCNPRFLKDKTFQIFYKNKLGPVYITAHELLHFIFYDYFIKKRNNLLKRLTEDDLWRLSEIANEIILRSALFNILFKSEKFQHSDYPEHVEIIKTISKKIRRNINIDSLIDTVLKF